MTAINKPAKAAAAKVPMAYSAVVIPSSSVLSRAIACRVCAQTKARNAKSFIPSPFLFPQPVRREVVSASYRQKKIEIPK